MIDLASCGLTMARSLRSIGLPVRQTTRVLPRSPHRWRIASSISTLSCSARTTATGLRSLSFAIASSERIVKIESDQSRISVCPCSITNERPLRRSPSFESSPVAITPISALTMKMPPSVTSSIRIRNVQPPTSLPIVPGSSVCSRTR